MNNPNYYRNKFSEVQKKIESTHRGLAYNQKKILKQVKLCSRFRDKVYASIVLITLLKQSISRHSEKQICIALMKGISKIMREESEFLSFLLSTQSSLIVLNMAWTQRYVLRISNEFEEKAHLGRLSELRKIGLSDSFDCLLELGHYKHRTRKFPKLFCLKFKKKRRVQKVA